jgi:hypothetical protein
MILSVLDPGVIEPSEDELKALEKNKTPKAGSAEFLTPKLALLSRLLSPLSESFILKPTSEAASKPGLICQFFWNNEHVAPCAP